MEIRVASYVLASFILEREPNQWHTLAVLDTGLQATDFINTHARSHLYLTFDDVEEPRAHKEVATNALLRQGFAFADSKDKLLVCCRAGQGRSVALAYVISCQQHGVQNAVKLLNPTRHRPNRLVVLIGATLLETALSDNLLEFVRRSFMGESGLRSHGAFG